MTAVAAAAQFSPSHAGEVNPSNLTTWAKAWSGVCGLALLGSILAAGVVVVRRFEARYPHFGATSTSNRRASVQQPSTEHLEIMRLVYPTVLATFETLGAASLKGMAGLLELIAEGDTAVFKSPVLYIVLVVWLFCIANTVLWLRKVYKRFRTTECLPTEIGVTTFLSIIFALLFYEERQYISSASSGLLIISAFAVLAGIWVMIHSTKVNTIEQGQAKDHVRRISLAYEDTNPWAAVAPAVTTQVVTPVLAPPPHVSSLRVSSDIPLTILPGQVPMLAPSVEDSFSATTAEWAT